MIQRLNQVHDRSRAEASFSSAIYFISWTSGSWWTKISKVR
jgi:hypothetical protein